MQQTRWSAQELWNKVQKPREPVNIKPGLDVYLPHQGESGGTSPAARPDTHECDSMPRAHRCDRDWTYDARNTVRASFLRSVPSAEVEGKTVTAERAKLRSRHEVEVGSK